MLYIPEPFGNEEKPPNLYTVLKDAAIQTLVFLIFHTRCIFLIIYLPKQVTYRKPTFLL